MGTKEAQSRNRMERSIIDKYIHGDIFEIGCGDGRFYDKIKNKINVYIGIDIDSHAISILSDRLIRLDHNVFLINADKAQLDPDFDSSFDCVILPYNVLDELKNEDKVLSDAIRILKPNGYLIFSVHNSFYWKHILRNYPSNNKSIQVKMRSFKEIRQLMNKFPVQLKERLGYITSPYPYYIYQKIK